MTPTTRCGKPGPLHLSAAGVLQRRRLGVSRAGLPHLHSGGRSQKAAHATLPARVSPSSTAWPTSPSSANIALNLRGNPHNARRRSSPAASLPSSAPPKRSPTPRTAAASQLADDIIRHAPSPPASWVNRVWKWHFGTGIVNTPDNFGKPSAIHPRTLNSSTTSPSQLRDKGNWSIKKLQRR